MDNPDLIAAVVVGDGESEQVPLQQLGIAINFEPKTSGGFAL